MEQEKLFVVNEDPARQRENIIVFGVGGGGGNALNHIIESGVKGVDFVAANTDAKALNLNKAPNKIILGEKLTRGLGAGANPQVGMDAAKESMDRIKEYINGADMIFVTAGMGGGTGTGAAPVIAEVAKEAGVLVVGVVTLPFSFEMPKRMKTAQAGIEHLKKNVDALLVVENERLLTLADDKLRIVDAYKMVDEVLRQAVQGVTDLITDSGFINLDFADIKAIMTDGGTAIMGMGIGEGENRAEQAARNAIKSPLMSTTLEGAKGVLLNVTTGPDATLKEMTNAAEVIRMTADPDANVIWGHVVNEEMGDSVRVTLIATGFPESGKKPVPGLGGKKVPDDAAPVIGPRLITRTGDAARPPIRSIYPKARREADEGFEEARLQPPSEDDRNPFHGVPTSNFDQPAIFRRQPRG
ncbi:MAG: cell division protein FtsZ [Synergistaceae bacterium]|nr:cell division protein FtsZ [Synergistaceae bacterium]